MRPWLYRHRHAIVTAYVVFAVTAILILQLLEANGAIR